MVRKTLGCRESTLKAMNRQRHEKLLCDVKISVDGGIVFAHKTVLAACSPYFHSMFTARFKEGESPIAEVDMSEVFPDLSTAEHVIQSMYTDQFDVTPDNVCTLYGVFSFLLFDEPKLICEAFMSKRLSLDTCMEYWEATHYYNLSGELRTAATDLLRNRFHDHHIYQEFFSHVARSTVSILLQEHITKFCSPKQILTFLINWFLKSDLIEGNILRQLVQEAHLPATCNFRQMVYEIQSSMAMTRSNRQAIAQVYEEMFSVVQARDQNNGEKRERYLRGTTGEKAPPLDGEIVAGEKSSSVNDTVTGNERFSGEDLMEENHFTHINKACRELDDCSLGSHSICDSKIPTELFFSPAHDHAVDRLLSHMPGDISHKTERADVFLALAPGSAEIQEDANAPRQLRLFAYVRRAQLWIDLGIIGYPTREGGQAMHISKFQFCAAGENIFLISKKEVFFSCLPWREWRMVVLPSDGGSERQIYPLPLEGMMYIILIERVEELTESIGGQRPSFNERFSIFYILILGMITKDGQWEEIIVHKEKEERRGDSLSYGPCWIERSCFLVHRGLFEWNFLLLDPARKDIQFVAAKGMRHSLVPMKDMLGAKPCFLEHGALIHACRGESEYRANSKKVRLTFQLNDDQSYVTVQEPAGSIAFKNSVHVEGKYSMYQRALLPDDPASQIWITSGPCLWRFSNTTMGKSFMHELNVQQPDVEIEHTPPPCNVILAATAATIDSAFLCNQPLARFLHICDPTKEEKTSARLIYDSDKYDDESESDSDDSY